MEIPFKAKSIIFTRLCLGCKKIGKGCGERRVIIGKTPC